MTRTASYVHSRLKEGNRVEEIGSSPVLQWLAKEFM
jgi:hypothetical protein